MRELTEQEKQAVVVAQYNWLVPATNAEKVSFQAGFEAGLEYAQNRIDELESALNQALKVAEQSIKVTQSVAADMQPKNHILST